MQCLVILKEQWAFCRSSVASDALGFPGRQMLATYPKNRFSVGLGLEHQILHYYKFDPYLFWKSSDDGINSVLIWKLRQSWLAMELRYLLSNDPMLNFFLPSFCFLPILKQAAAFKPTVQLSIVPLGTIESVLAMKKIYMCTDPENPAIPSLMVCNKYRPVAQASSPQWVLRLVLDTLVLHLYELTDPSVNFSCLLLRGNHSGMTLTKPLCFQELEKDISIMNYPAGCSHLL